jgi:hypothetical protein
MALRPLTPLDSCPCLLAACADCLASLPAGMLREEEGVIRALFREKKDSGPT